ncbi:MAG: hypothetical protein KatS3mg057_3078 [Herpetosiphonaceae bacterium]|nr:MAG: hypothetical protein KatS3mg057_3078 [Herpetosiphonaceae bacterium]
MLDKHLLQRRYQRHIALIGLSGTGKTSAGRLLAQQLGRPFVDTDVLVEQAAGRSIAEIFSSDGEEAFRDLEAAALTRAIAGEPAVIATGGGIVLREDNRRLLRDSCWTVWLKAALEYLARRVESDTSERPLLRGGAAARLAALLAEREPLYAAIADWSIATDQLSPEEVSTAVARCWREQQAPESLWVTAGNGCYPVIVAAGALDLLSSMLDSLGISGRCWLISDDQLGPLYTEQVVAALPGRRVSSFAVPSGEQSKSLEQVSVLYDWLLAGGVERGDVVLALGGGVVGDLAGFVASTILRGIALVQLPTTTLAMIDSSIGGKTGVNHPRGKNLIGTFYPPRLVLADTRTLRTLPPREYVAGLAEGIKHGIIADAGLFADLEDSIQALLRLEEPLTSNLLRRAAAVKVDIVSADERESHRRMVLNYGHTLGHALEVAAGYGTLLHGEAISIGMELAGRIALRLGLFSQAELERQRALLRSAGLPTRLPAGLTADVLLAPVGLDKKRQGGSVRWVLPERIGSAVVVDHVPLDLVREIVAEAIEESR